VIYEWDPAKARANFKKHCLMSKASPNKTTDDLRPEYDLLQLKGGVTGKYYRKARAGTNLVLIEPELAGVFPDTESVNRALRLLVETASEIVRPAPARRKSSTPRTGARRQPKSRSTRGKAVV
jgi:hypothetical protein